MVNTGQTRYLRPYPGYRYFWLGFFILVVTVDIFGWVVTLFGKGAAHFVAIPAIGGVYWIFTDGLTSIRDVYYEAMVNIDLGQIILLGTFKRIEINLDDIVDISSKRKRVGINSHRFVLVLGNGAAVPFDIGPYHRHQLTTIINNYQIRHPHNR